MPPILPTNDASTEPSRGVFSFHYTVEPPTCGRCQLEEVGTVHVVVDNIPMCGDCWNTSDCLEQNEAIAVGQVLEALDRIDTALWSVHEQDKSWVYSVAIDLLFKIGNARVAAGREELLPDRVFVDDLVRRRPEAMEPELMWRLVMQFAPDLSREDVEVNAREAETRHARALGDEVIADACLLVLARADGGPGNEVTVGEAVTNLGIDFERFMGGLTTVCAELGVGPRDLPPDVVNDLIAGAKISGQGGDR